MTETDSKVVFDIPCAEICVEVSTGKIIKYNDDFLDMFGIERSYAETHELNADDYLDKTGVEEMKARFLQNSGDKDFAVCYLHGLNLPTGKQAVAIGVTKPYNGSTEVLKTSIIDISEMYDTGKLDKRKSRLIFESDVLLHFKYTKDDFDNQDYLLCYGTDQMPGETVKPVRLHIMEEDRHRLFSKLKSAWSNEPHLFRPIDFYASTDDKEFHHYRADYYMAFGEKPEKSYIIGKIIEVDGEDESEADVEKSLAAESVLSSIDGLTGLIRYNKFRLAMASYLKMRDKSKSLAIAYFDINNFAYINENFGVEAGNELLIETAKLIKNADGTVAVTRVHSDLFVAAVEASTDVLVMKKLEKMGKLFYVVHSQQYPRNDISLTAGVCFLTPDDTDVRAAVDNANIARSSIKSDRQKWICVFNDKLKAQKLTEQEIRSTIHQAIEDGEIEAFLQPKFSMKRMKIIGAEALARWRNSDGTYKQPGEFIPILENTGYIIDLDFEIYRQILELIKKWLADGVEPVPISVNFSRVHNNYNNFVWRVLKMTSESGVDPKYIEIEITESMLAKDPQISIANMKAFVDFGFRIDMDDFGTGYSSLSFLRDAPIDTVKVDKTFVDRVNTSQKDKEYVKQLCKLIETTEKDILFEGIETNEQAEFFKDCGFDKAQGWLFDKAIPISEFNKKYMYND